MPEFRGKSIGNRTLKKNAKKIPHWKSLHLYETNIDNDGIEFLKEAVNLEEMLMYGNRLIGDSSMRVLCDLPRIKSLMIYDSLGITDEGISSIKNIDNLRELYLDRIQLSDDGIEYISSRKKMFSLRITNTLVTDKSLDKISSMEELMILDVSNNSIQGESICHIPDWDRLYLSMDNCGVSDQSIIRYCESHRRTEALSLSGTEVTDNSLESLAGCEKLTEIRLNNTKVTDKGISFFLGHPALSTLYLEGTVVTPEHVQELKEKAPRRLSVYL